MFYLVLSLLALPAYGSNICCAPDQYEASEGLLTGSVNDEKDSAATYGTIAFSYDAKNRTVFESLRLTVTNQSHNYKMLHLYKQNTTYIIEGNVCSKAGIERPWSPSCIPSNATALPVYNLGPKNQSLTVQEYTFKVDTNTITVGSTGNCIPIIYKSYGEINGQGVMTFTAFRNLTLGISDQHIFDVPDICKHAQPADDAYLRTRRSVVSKILSR